MNTLHVVNIKCGGCEKKITSTLEKAGLSQVTVSAQDQTVSFEGDADNARRELSGLGYPEAGSPEADSLIKKGHSLISCAIGRMS